MHEKIGRNDPCPCSSGKKYKQCCLAKQSAPTVSVNKHEGAVGRALQWLYDRHRKTMQTAMDDLLDLLVNEEVRSFFYDAVNEEDWIRIRVNLTEWLLAEGDILVKDTVRRVSDVLLGPGGPLFTVEQRAWLQQLTAQALRLYEVTDVVPGAQLTLCDILNADALPIVVDERSASHILTPGSMLGCRIMRVDEHFELSDAAYPFPPDYAPVVAAELRAFVEEELAQAQDTADAEMPRSMSISISIMAAWILQYITPLSMPDLMDAYSQEPILLITDYYQVGNWQALADALAACSDVQGNRDEGWSHIIEGAEGEAISVASINLEKESDRISIFYQTQRYADEGRAWFDSVVGDAATFLIREIQDPLSIIAQTKNAMAEPADSGGTLGLDPQLMSQMVETEMRRYYADWPEQTIPALDNKTPRQMLQTPAGLERVKGLIRSYEANEARMAARDGRPEVAFDFLWEAIGIAP